MLNFKVLMAAYLYSIFEPVVESDIVYARCATLMRIMHVDLKWYSMKSYKAILSSMELSWRLRDQHIVKDRLWICSSSKCAHQ